MLVHISWMLHRRPGYWNLAGYSPIHVIRSCDYEWCNHVLYDGFAAFHVGRQDLDIYWVSVRALLWDGNVFIRCG
jgi:hypothetical protein